MVSTGYAIVIGIIGLAVGAACCISFIYKVARKAPGSVLHIHNPEKWE